MRNQREPWWLKVLAACWVIAMLAIAVRVLVFLPSERGSAAHEAESAAAAKPHCATRQMRMACFRDDSES
jgi:hypothetical protein